MKTKMMQLALRPKAVTLMSCLSLALIVAPQRCIAQSLLAQEAANIYPQEAIDSFVKACTDVNSPTVPPEMMQQICECSIAQIQTKYTLEALQHVDANIRTGAPLPADITGMVQTCTQKVINQK